jgi:isopentenyldiphosphate isomerase
MILLRPSFFIQTGDYMSNEYLDVVNEDDEVISKELRSEVHRLGLRHRGVHVFLITKDGRLLVQKRSLSRDNFPMALDCSVSEHVKAGEDYLQAAMRGLLEEMGILQADLRPLVKFTMTYGINDEEVSLLYECGVDPHQVRFDPEEVEGVYYYSLDELETMIAKGEVRFCYWFIQLIRWYLGEPSELRVLETFSGKRRLIPGKGESE